MAFMGEDCWKSGLSAFQLTKISQIEKQRDAWKTDLSKKSINFDILQQTLDKEKRRVSLKLNKQYILQYLDIEAPTLSWFY
jgi:hypothetical protein